LRETTVALDEALDADTPNEALIEQRVRESGEAQTALIRLRALTDCFSHIELALASPIAS